MTEVSPNRTEDGPPIVFGTEEEDVDLRQYKVEDWLTLAFFWLLALVVFLQFFTRYVLNDSLAWTEEIARYVLIGVTFLGGAIAVRRNTNIHVEFLYVYLPPRLGAALSTAVDVLRVVFLALCTWLAWSITEIMHFQRMVVFDWPMSYIYVFVVIGFAAMTVRAVQVAARHWRAGGSDLTRVRTEGRHQ